MKQLFLLFLFLFWQISSPLQAQDLLSNFNKTPMPVIPGLEKSKWEQESVLYDKKPLGENSFNYTVRLPKAWQKIGEQDVFDASQITKIFTEVALYVSPPDAISARSRFTLKVLELDYAQSAQQWLAQYLTAQSYKTEGFGAIDDTQAEALYFIVEKDNSFVVRGRAIISGKQLILAEYAMPIEKWNDEKSIQASVLDSFRLTNLADTATEDLKSFPFLDIAVLKYPASWTLRSPPPSSTDVMNAQLLNIFRSDDSREREILNGKIGITLLSVFEAGSKDEEINLIKENFTKEGFVIGEALPNPEAFKFGADFNDGSVHSYKVTKTDTSSLNYEFWITSMMSGDYYYFLTLLTASREQDFAQWSRNTKALQLVAEQFEAYE